MENLRLLSRSAVIFRYSGESAGPEEAEAALHRDGAIRRGVGIDRMLILL